MNDQDENTQAYLHELAIWKARRGEALQLKGRARSLRTIQHCAQELAHIEEEIQNCHRTFCALTGKKSIQEEDLWSSAD